jgi:hypothetical protein
MVCQINQVNNANNNLYNSNSNSNNNTNTNNINKHISEYQMIDNNTVDNNN